MVTNPILKYYGGKFRLARWIISHFPRHDSYVEPFGGGGSVLLQKPPSAIETYNDLDGDVCNFFLVVRDRVDELIRAIRLTPWSRDEFELCLHSASDPLERARRLYFRLWMSFHGGTLSTASSFRRRRYKRSAASDVRPQAIYEAAKRLTLVQIENRDAMKLIIEMDTPTTLFYLDPPYVSATRTDKKRYAHEMTDADHSRLAELLNSIRGFAVVSGYVCELYREIYERLGWHRIDTEATANGGIKRVESLWLSPRTIEAIS